MISSLFGQEEQDYCKAVVVGDFYSNNYIECKSNSGRNKTPSRKQQLDKIKPCLKDIMKNLKKSDRWKVQLTIAITFISSKVTDEKREIH